MDSFRTKSDLEAFKKLFGEYQNATNIIANVTTDLAEIAARDTMYNRIKSVSKAYGRCKERELWSMIRMMLRSKRSGLLVHRAS